jgi:hypothetical protein
MVMPLVLPDALEAVLDVLEVLDVLLLSGWAPFRWPCGWKVAAGSAVDGAEEMALKLMGVPSAD